MKAGKNSKLTVLMGKRFHVQVSSMVMKKYFECKFGDSFGKDCSKEGRVKCISR